VIEFTNEKQPLLGFELKTESSNRKQPNFGSLEMERRQGRKGKTGKSEL